LEKFGNFPKNLEKFGEVWRSLEKFGGKWLGPELHVILILAPIAHYDA
jgi:hypothetical protein